ncbi:MAG: hypothetical protein ACXWRZ_13565 [Bdellovibrio sp.]
MKLVNQTLTVMFSLLAGLSTKADINDTFRQQNAVALYEFKETSGDIIDTADPKFGAPLNLRPFYSGYVRVPGTLKITEPNVIRSIDPADKITNACKANKGLTIEVLLENSESVEKRAGFDDKKRTQPLRILTLSRGLFDRNFLLGQFYDSGNLYEVAVNTNGNENTTDKLGGSLVEPLATNTSSLILADTYNAAQGTTYLQKVIFTLSSDGVGKLYLSDRKGNLYLAETASSGFAGSPSNYFDSWRSGAYLTLGNEFFSSKADADSKFALNDTFSTCTTAECMQNPNRFWKGNIHLVAVYCQALSQEQIFGIGSLQTVINNLFDIDTGLTVTPTLYKAQEIYQRITSNKTPITNPILKDMEKLLLAGDPVGAAALATEETGFYNTTVKDFAAKMSNRDETINVPLNDFSATLIGVVRDNLDARKLLYENLVYVADPTKAAVPSDWVDDILKSNNHYEALGNGRFDLSKVLVPTTQKLFDGTTAVENPTPAGLLTSRQWLASHAIAGTNRRLVEYSLREFLCTPIDKAADSSGPEDVIARDIDRYPGGLNSKFTTTCRACHTIMDGFRPAFANFTFSNNFVKHAYVVPSLDMSADEDKSIGMKQNPRYVAAKLNQNETVFPEGRVTTDDSWVNNANRGINATNFGWTRDSGKGIAEFGKMISESKAFPRCMAQRVFRSVCKREVASSEQTMIDQVAAEFSSQRNYNLKFLFQKIVSTPECLGSGE